MGLHLETCKTGWTAIHSTWKDVSLWMSIVHSLTSFRYTRTWSSLASTRSTSGANELGGDPSWDEKIIVNYTITRSLKHLGTLQILKCIRTGDVSAMKPDRSLMSTITMLVLDFGPSYLYGVEIKGFSHQESASLCKSQTWAGFKKVKAILTSLWSSK